jgi:hypothetical protein
MAHQQRPLHIVQIGHDDHYFESGAANSDSLERQQSYARILETRRLGSLLSLVALTVHPIPSRLTPGALMILPVHLPRFRYFYRLWRQLTSLHRRRRIDSLTSQNVYAEGWVALAWARAYGTFNWIDEHENLHRAQAVIHHAPCRSFATCRSSLTARCISAVGGSSRRSCFLTAASNLSVITSGSFA